jgi:hypothetical protein
VRRTPVGGLNFLRLFFFKKYIKISCLVHRRRHRGDEGDRSPHFYSSIASFAVSGWIIPPRAKKIFRLAALAIIIPPTCESESAPLVSLQLRDHSTSRLDIFSTLLIYNQLCNSAFCHLDRVSGNIIIILSSAPPSLATAH